MVYRQRSDRCYESVITTSTLGPQPKISVVRAQFYYGLIDNHCRESVQAIAKLTLERYVFKEKSRARFMYMSLVKTTPLHETANILEIRAHVFRLRAWFRKLQ